MKTLILFDLDDKPVGRWTMPESEHTIPAVVLWNDRAFAFVSDMPGGFRYRQTCAVEIPYLELRRAPGLA